jgi:hypothetical protein
VLLGGLPLAGGTSQSALGNELPFSLRVYGKGFDLGPAFGEGEDSGVAPLDFSVPDDGVEVVGSFGVDGCLGAASPLIVGRFDLEMPGGLFGKGELFAAEDVREDLLAPGFPIAAHFYKVITILPLPLKCSILVLDFPISSLIIFEVFSSKIQHLCFLNSESSVFHFVTSRVISP